MPLEIEDTSRCGLPYYWNFNPVFWFAQVEAAFDSNRIRADFNRYNIVVSQLPPDVAHEVSDVILAPPLQNRYKTLKEAVLQRLSASQELQFR